MHRVTTILHTKRTPATSQRLKFSQTEIVIDLSHPLSTISLLIPSIGDVPKRAGQPCKERTGRGGGLSINTTNLIGRSLSSLALESYADRLEAIVIGCLRVLDSLPCFRSPMWA
ncbi:uncharacterized protein PV06_01807 [Exophiala oligosperma]|uniref:Uncharacterized protein n=1 Tax=Exophiala oligosperma TaxID=215243 RepID=A0A0D2C8I7_9EURO|nr:uncharacterized protein PV06_01807 [Exophiala oligosperma]KIW46117.1 hypothetical protein PV06_01807 [Exophiala oligosperma]